MVRQKYRPDGGAERVMADMLEAVGGYSSDITLITRRWNTDAALPVITCNPFGLGRTWNAWAFARAVFREIRGNRFDLVQCNERIAGCDIYRAGDGVHRQWLEERKRIVPAPRALLAALSPFHAYMKHAERKTLQSPRLRAVICNSRMVKREIIEHFGVDDAKLHVVYNGVNTEKFHPGLKQHRSEVRRELGIADDATVLIFVGSGFERKGLAQAIEAIGQVSTSRNSTETQPPDAHLIVVGRDSRQRKFRRLAARRKVAQRVHFLGVKEDVRPYYGAADALLLPTVYEPFGLVVLEAMATAMPVITSTKCGAAELLVPDGTGYVHDAMDVESMAESIRKLGDRSRCQRMGIAARQTAERHTLEVIREELSRLYEQLLSEKEDVRKAA